MTPFVEQHLEEILIMRKNFLTWDQIKEVLNYPKETCLLSSAFYRVAKAKNIEPPLTKFSTKKYDKKTVESWRDMTYSQIHLLTDMSFVSVMNLCKKYGVSIKSGKVSKPRINKDEILMLSSSGLSETEIALKIGCSHKTAKKILEEGSVTVDKSDCPLSYFVPLEIKRIALGRWGK